MGKGQVKENDPWTKTIVGEDWMWEVRVGRAGESNRSKMGQL